jgi:hypothetical protein
MRISPQLFIGAACGAVAVLALAVHGAPSAPASPPAAPAAPSKALPSDVPSNSPAADAVNHALQDRIMDIKPDGKFDGAQPVTRYELAVTLDRFITFIETAHKPLRSAEFPTPSSSLTAPAGHWAHDAQFRLVKYGFVPLSSPLLKKPGTGVLTADDLSAIMASVTIRLNDRSMPVTQNAGPVD